MTYWLMLATVYYAHVFGVYPSKEACEAAGEHAAWFQTASCIPRPPAREQEHQHPQP